jgi:hypothetical protein
MGGPRVFLRAAVLHPERRPDIVVSH